MRIRPIYATIIGAICCLAALNSQGQTTTTTAAPSKAPLGAPPSNEATAAYQFRTTMGSDPQCQDIAQEADNVFLNDQLDPAKKADQLAKLKARAKAVGCLQ